MKFSSCSAFTISAALLIGTTTAHIGHGTPGHVKRASTSSERHLRYDRRQNTEQGVASSNNSAALCNASPPNEVFALLKNYPALDTVADILGNDTQALAIMQAINATGLIPTDIQPHGSGAASHQGGGNLQGGYNYNTDPDCWWTSTTCDTPKHKGILNDITTCDEPHTWGYTFDDGPSCQHNDLYDFWAQNNQKASLMYIGSNIMSYPLEAQRGIMDGHHICVHTWSHQYTTTLTTNQVFAELYYTIKAMKEVMGITPTCWRPPYGDVDDRVRAIAQSLGLRTYVWNADTNDWNITPGGPAPTSSIQANYASIKSIGTSPAAQTGGVVVLDHELTVADMNLAIAEYPSIKQSWKYIVPLSACLNVTQPYAEDIIYPNFADYIGGTVLPSGVPTTPPTISAVSTVTLQGTLSGMSNLMATAEAGGPQGPVATSASYTLSNAQNTSGSQAKSTSTSSSGEASSDNSNSKSGAQALAWKVPFTLVIGSFSSALFFVFLF